jgi:peroxiredoxin
VTLRFGSTAVLKLYRVVALRLRAAVMLSVFFCGLTQAAAEHPLLGQSAPDFALKAVAGSNVRLSEQRGSVVVLSFWNIRCASCSQQLAALNASLSTYQSAGLVVWGVGVDESALRAANFAAAQSVTFPMLLDPAKHTARSYQVDNLPLTVLIDRDGIVRFVQRDYSEQSNQLYLQQLRKLLDE